MVKKNKVGRKPLPVSERRVTVSLRLLPKYARLVKAHRSAALYVEQSVLFSRLITNKQMVELVNESERSGKRVDVLVHTAVKELLGKCIQVQVKP